MAFPSLSASTLGLSVEPLAPFGAIVRGVDMSRSLTAAEVGELKSYLYEYHVLIFRGHDAPDDAGYVNFLRNFGTPILPDYSEDLGEDAANLTYRPNQREITMITSKIVENGREVGFVGDGHRGLPWHTDYSWNDAVADVGSLEARVVTSQGGETCFANMYAVYDSLTPEMRTYLGHLRAYNGLRIEGGQPPCRGYEHPLVITCPYNGRRALYISSYYTINLLGLPEDEAGELYRALIDFSLAPRFILEHFWQVDDLVIWDEIGTIHTRKPFPENEPRYLRQALTLVDDKDAPWSAFDFGVDSPLQLVGGHETPA